MAIPGGYRFSVPFDDVFPDSAFVFGVEQTFDWDRNGHETPAKATVTGKLVWSVQVMPGRPFRRWCSRAASPPGRVSPSRQQRRACPV